MSTNGEPPPPPPPLIDHHQEEGGLNVSVSHSSLISTSETLIDGKLMDQSRVYEQESVEIVQNKGVLDLNDGDLVDTNPILRGQIGDLGASLNDDVIESVDNGGQDLPSVEASGGDDGGTNFDANGAVPTEKGGEDSVNDGMESVGITEKDSEDKNEGTQEYAEMEVDTEGREGVKESADGAVGTGSVGVTEKDTEDQNKCTQMYEDMKIDDNQSVGSPSHKESYMGSIVVDLDASSGMVGKETVVEEEGGGDAGDGGEAGGSKTRQKRKTRKQSASLEQTEGTGGSADGGETDGSATKQNRKTRKQSAGLEQTEGTGESATKQKRKTRNQSAGLEQPEGTEFANSDLVWGKVKSHPWWPGQIVDPSYASEQAMKHYKKDRFFVAYFGDQTYAWNEPGSLKPFGAGFPEMDKQSIAPPFVYAVNSALDEVSRRVELGLSCSCTPEDVYNVMKSHKIVNSGIKGEVCATEFVERYFSVASFEPDKLVKYIKSLSLGQSFSSDRLGFVVSQAQLAAFYRWKGNFRLPYFHLFVGLSGDAEHATLVSENVEVVDSGNTKPKSQQKPALEKQDNLEEKSSNKKRSLTELMDQKLSSGKKHKSTASPPINEGGQSKKQGLTPSPSSATKSPSSRAYRVGDRLLSIARQLSGSPPILKNNGDGFQKNVSKVDGGSKKLHEVDVITHIPGRTLDTPIATQEDNSSAHEMLSQLFLAAKDPTKGYSFLTTVVGFFTNFRNSISSDSSPPVKQKKAGKKRGSTVRGGKRRKRSSKITSSESDYQEDDDDEDVSDSYWTDRIIQSSPEVKSSSRRSKRKAELALDISTTDSLALEPETSHDLNTISGSKEEDTSTGEAVNTFQAITTESKEECPDDTTGLITNESLEEKKESEEFTPTELILEFTNAKTVPSELDLNNIFSPFGSLKEETKILKKTRRAVVVFQRHADADAAYNNACKYSVFGPALLSYELRPSRSPLRTTAQSGVDATPLEDTQIDS